MTSLKVQKVEPYQFVNKEFTIVVTLPDTFPDISRRTSNLPLKVDVCYEEEAGNFDPLDRNYNPSLIDVVTNTNIDRSRRGVVTVRLKDASANHDNRKFIIRFIVFTLEGDLSSVYGYSMPITVVRYKLKIQEEFANQGSYIWMKDVGGKDKSIDLQILLMDTNENVVVNRKVPLRVMLIYANGVPVPQQDILQLSPDSQLFVGHNGFTRIKCRINEVSSRHQGQLFQICVIPDFDLPSPLADISPARSVPVEVKSKINFSHKRKLQGGSSSSAAYPTGGEQDSEDSGNMRAMYNSTNTNSFDPYRSRGAAPSSSLPVSSVGLQAPSQNFMGGNIAQLIKTGNSLGPVGVSANLNHVSALPTTVPLNDTGGHSSSLLPLSSVLSSNRLADVASSSGGSSNGAFGMSAGGYPIPAAMGLYINTAAVPPAAVAVPVQAALAATDNSGIAESATSTPSAFGGYNGLQARRMIDPAAEAAMYHRGVRYPHQQLPAHITTPRMALLSAHASSNNLMMDAASQMFPSVRGPSQSLDGAAAGPDQRQGSGPALLTPQEALEAAVELGAWTEQVLTALTVMQWTPIGSLQGEINPETKLPANTADRVLYSMQNPNKLIEALTQRFQSRVAPTLGTLQHFIANCDHSSAPSAPTPTPASSSRPQQAPGAGTASSSGAQATHTALAVPQVAPQPGTINTNGAYSAVNYSTSAASAHTAASVMADAAARLRGGSVYEDSNVRLVYMAKYVYAVQGGAGGAGGAAGAGAQHDLGVAVFGRVNEETQFIGFYNKDAQGQLVFRSFQELLSIASAAAALTGSGAGLLDQPTAAGTNANSSAGGNNSGNTVNSTGNSTISSTVSNGVATAAPPASAQDPVAQLLAQIGPAELFSSLPVSRDAKTGQFDLTLLLEQWRVWGDNERLCIHID